MATNNHNFEATVNAGVAAVKEWQRGDIVHLERFETQCLTPKGKEIMGKVTRMMPDDEVRRIMTEAVAAGY